MFDTDGILHKALSDMQEAVAIPDEWQEIRRACRALHPGRRVAAGEPVWIFGTGSFGRSLANACRAQGVTLRGFVQTCPSQPEIDGLPVCSWCELSATDKTLPLLVGIFNREIAFDGLHQLAQKAGCRDIRLPWDYYDQFAPTMGWRYWLAAPTMLADHFDDLAKTLDRLEDSISKAVLLAVLRMRLGLDLEAAASVSRDAQYFNELTLPAVADRDVRYLDGGAYTGDSLIQLMNLATVQEAWMLEPDSANFSRLSTTVRSRRLPALCLPLALSDGYRLLRFSAGQGEAARVDPNGEAGISTVAIDDLLAGRRVDFIKLDVEGSEVAALRGAAQTLAQHQPVLAVSAYHRPADIWVLPNLIDELCPGGYTFHLRQHAFNSFELVLYAVPVERCQ